MISFSPDRFSTYARDLEQAILGLSRERMGATSELRNVLGRDDVEVRFGGGRQFVTMNGQTIELSATATPEDVAQALNVAKVDAAVQAIALKLPPAPVVDMAPLKAVLSGGGVPNPIPATARKNLTGASFLANLIRQQQAAIKKQIAEAGTEMQAAMTELQDVANEATNQVKAVKAETADLRAALGLNSNGAPETE